MNGTKSVVLLVEDDPLILLHLRIALEDGGHEVIAVPSADQALIALGERHDITALFTDVQLPGRVNGIELAETVRRADPDLTIVITSGMTALPAAKLPEGSRFIAKPYTAAQLRRVLGGDTLAA